MKGLFQLCKSLFNVSIVERSKVDVWHRDVRFFDVYDLDISESDPAGSFYFDPYSRDQNKLSENRNSGWVQIVRNRSTINDLKPLSSLIFNFQPPGKDGENSRITFKAVQSLFGNVRYLFVRNLLS